MLTNGSCGVNGLRPAVLLRAGHAQQPPHSASLGFGIYFGWLDPACLCIDHLVSEGRTGPNYRAVYRQSRPALGSPTRSIKLHGGGPMMNGCSGDGVMSGARWRNTYEGTWAWPSVEHRGCHIQRACPEQGISTGVGIACKRKWDRLF